MAVKVVRQFHRTPRGATRGMKILMGLAFCFSAFAMDVGCSAQENMPGTLAKALARVSRGSDDDPGKIFEAIHRLTLAQHLDLDSELGRMLTAYQRGESQWRGSEGAPVSMKVIGFAPIDWRSQKAIPAWKGPRANDEPFVMTVMAGELGNTTGRTRVGFSPIEITENLSCGVYFVVIPNLPVPSPAEELDFLEVSIELYGGGPYVSEASPYIEPDTFFDLWSSTKNKRHSITKWSPLKDEFVDILDIEPKEAESSPPVGHVGYAYAPLLFDVLNNDPDFLFLENLKIKLPWRFKKGCRQLCAEVLRLREAQGQNGLPVCREPSKP